VVTKWRHNVTWKSGCFSAPERGNFLKNSGVLELTKMGPFWECFVHGSACFWLSGGTGQKAPDDLILSEQIYGVPILLKRSLPFEWLVRSLKHKHIKNRYPLTIQSLSLTRK